MKFQVNLASNHNVCVDNVDMSKMHKKYFVNDIFKSES